MRLHLVRGYVGILLILLVVTFHAASLDADTEPPANGKIVFVSNRDGNSEIYTMNSNGSDVQRLTHNTVTDRDPAWSPEGTKIAFTSENSDKISAIYIINADGTDIFKISMEDSVSDRHPVWSPDGDRIAFTRRTLGQLGDAIYIMNADGSDATRIVDSKDVLHNVMPTWSPDGTQLFFSATDNPPAVDPFGSFQFYTVNVDGSGKSAIIPNGTYGNPDWSWINNRVVTYTFGQYGAYLYSMNSSAADFVIVTDDEEQDAKEPAWSPDGQKIVFSARKYPEEDYDIYIINSDGTNQINLTNNDGVYDSDPDWQPISN